MLVLLSPSPPASQLIDEFRQATVIDKAKGSRSDSIVHIRRGSELAPGSHDLPKMKLDDFNLLVVLGKGSFGKVSSMDMHPPHLHPGLGYPVIFSRV